jgi:acetyl esterase/lipase
MLNFNLMLKKAIVPVLICLIAVFFFFKMKTKTVIPLYDEQIPNARPSKNEETFKYEPGEILIVSKISRPTLTVFLPPREKSTGVAVIICPGGGYVNLAMGYEGEDVARRFNESGIAAFVLKYRMPDDHTMFKKEIGPLQDAQRAILLLRSKANEWGIDKKRIGIMGFSAGGHLASTAGTHFEKNYIDNPANINLRPDFMLLIYPVISFDGRIGHMGSMHNLLGPNPSQEQIREFSNETRVSDQTPPSFLVHAKDDSTVPYENSIVFADSLKKHHVPAEIFLYEKGGHGFGMTNLTDNRSWMDSCIRWVLAFKPGTLPMHEMDH